MTKGAREQGKARIEILKKSLMLCDKCLLSGQKEEGLFLLEKAQETAIELGGIIESSEGEGFVTVSFLEEFCEELFQFHETLSEEYRKKLENTLLKAEESFFKDIKLKKETVFLPYKASMWDSLEGIWERESKEEDTDVYVIPIPYFDKNPDGTFRKEHYEIDQYPKNVPVISYESYDLEKRRPDKVYIHNPYDESNYVTSVHPMFYSKRLKDLTGELIYVPYFVLADPISLDEASLKGMNHFVILPGVVHSHHTIVQSEQMKKAYVNILTSWAGEGTRGVWEQKILGTGSPKFERVEKIKREDVEIPEEWKSKLGDRKVILYNTSVSSILEYGDRMLDKIERVLDVFRENKEVVLLWRPHPLMEATLSSMRPELFDRYKNIVEKYRESGLGIFDDSADLDRAIALCDAYYGDPSSVVQLVRRVKKPVMIQNVDV